MSRTSAPVLTSLLLLQLLLLLPRNSTAAAAVAASKQLESASCKTLDEVLLEKYVTRQKRSSSNEDVSENATTLLPSGLAMNGEFNWRGLYLLLQDRAEQLCDKQLYQLLNERYSGGELATFDRRDNAIASAVPQTEFEDQQANNVTSSSTAQKESTWINASTTITYNNDESSGKFSTEDSTTMSYYDSTSSADSNQTFTIADNEASGSNSNETIASNNEDESHRNEAIHTRSKEDFVTSVYRDKEQRFGQDNDIVERFLEAEHQIIDVDESRGHSKEINNTRDDSSTVEEHDPLVDAFFANENENSSSSSIEADAANSTFTGKHADEDNDDSSVSEHDQLVDDFFANESGDISNDDSDDNKTKSDHDKFVDKFFANESEDFSNNDSSENTTVSEHDEVVDEFFANESEDFSNNNSSENTTVSEHDEVVDEFFAHESEDSSNNDSSENATVSEHDEVVDEFFAHESEDLSNNDSSENTTVSEHDKLVDDFFAHEEDDFSKNQSESSATRDKFVDDFFANEDNDLSTNGIRRNETKEQRKEMSVEMKDNDETVSEHDPIVDDFFASENENPTTNGIENEGPNGASKAPHDDKSNDNKSASDEFNSAKSLNDDVSSSSTDMKELPPSMELFVAAFSSEKENVTNWEESRTNNTENSAISSELPATRSAEEFSQEANFTSSELAEIADFFNNGSGENFTSELENSTEIPDSSELISSREYLEVAISEEKNAETTTTTTAQLWTYSNETAATMANGTEDQSTKYPDTGDRDKAGHTLPSDDDLFKETTTTTKPSLDDWSSTIASIESLDKATSVSERAAVRRRRSNVLMAFRDEAVAAPPANAPSAGKLRTLEATSSWLVDDSSSDAREPNDSASSRNRNPRIITAEMNKDIAQLRGQYRTFLLGSQHSEQTQFAEKRDSRSKSSSSSRISAKVEQ